MACINYTTDDHEITESIIKIQPKWHHMSCCQISLLNRRRQLNLCIWEGRRICKSTCNTIPDKKFKCLPIFWSVSHCTVSDWPQERRARVQTAKSLMQLIIDVCHWIEGQMYPKNLIWKESKSSFSGSWDESRSLVYWSEWQGWKVPKWLWYIQNWHF